MSDTARDTAPGAASEKHCKSCKCSYQSDEKRWNDAIDWLLNSPYTGDPECQGRFWALVDGLTTRDKVDFYDYRTEAGAG